jgi:hypothetical protein
MPRLILPAWSRTLIGVDGGVVDEHVLVAVWAGNEAIPLVRVEPLDDPNGHETLSLPSRSKINVLQARGPSGRDSSNRTATASLRRCSRAC